MCAIGGIVDLNGNQIASHNLTAMSSAMAHRGSDDEGFILINRKSNERRSAAGPDCAEDLRRDLPTLNRAASGFAADIGLLQRRFSIIDLSSAGHQPYIDMSAEIILAYNGEIYNYVELRKELEDLGWRFNSSTDTEVFAKAFRQWGNDCFSKFNGFWAAAIYDMRSRALFLTRDRLGKKPLYWTRRENLFYFASEIKALLAVSEISSSREVELSALYPWIRHTLIPDDHTFFQGINKLPPATIALIDRNFPDTIRRFWQPPSDRESAGGTLEQYSEQLRHLISDAVKIRLRADVPVGIELSGGLDSSAIAAFAARSGKPMQSFTVKTNSSEDEDASLGSLIAQNHSFDHHILELNNSAEFWQDIKAFTWLQEAPYHSPNLRTNQLIWEWMRSAGIKVSLNGLGGDELFGGYSYYRLPAILENFKQGKWGAGFSNFLLSSEYTSPISSAGRIVRDFATFTAARSQNFSSFWTRYKLGLNVLPPADHDQRSFFLSERLTRDVLNDRIPYWLQSGDASSMGIPFEVRAPLLDYRIVELALRMPPDLCVRGGWHKWILRHSLDGLLPPQVVWRRKKAGYPFPSDDFFSASAPILSKIAQKADERFFRIRSAPSLLRHWPTLSFILWYEFFIKRNEELFDEIQDIAKIALPTSAVRYQAAYQRHFNQRRHGAGLERLQT